MARKKIARPSLWELAELLAQVPDTLSYLYHDSELRPWTERRTRRLFAFRKTCVKIPDRLAFAFYEPENQPGQRHAELFSVIPSIPIRDALAVSYSQESDEVRERVDEAERLRDEFVRKLSNRPADSHFPHTVVDLVSNHFAYDIIDANEAEIGDSLARAVAVVLRESTRPENVVRFIYLFLDLLYFPRPSKSATAKLGWRHLPLASLLTVLQDAAENQLAFPLFPHAPRKLTMLKPAVLRVAKRAYEMAYGMAQEMYGDLFDYLMVQIRLAIFAQALDPKMSLDEPPVPRTYLNMLVRELRELVLWSPDYANVLADRAALSAPKFPVVLMLTTEWNKHAWSTTRPPREVTVLRGADLRQQGPYKAALERMGPGRAEFKALNTLPDLRLDTDWSPRGSYQQQAVLDGESSIYALLLHALLEEEEKDGLPVVLVQRVFRGYNMLQAVILCKRSLGQAYEPAPGTAEREQYREQKRQEVCDSVRDIESPSPLSASGVSLPDVEGVPSPVGTSDDESDESAPSEQSAQSVEVPPRASAPTPAQQEDAEMQGGLRLGFAAPGSIVSEPSEMSVEDVPSLSGSLPMDVEPSFQDFAHRDPTEAEILALIARERAAGNPYVDKIAPLRPGQQPRPGWQRLPGTWTVYDINGRPINQWGDSV